MTERPDGVTDALATLAGVSELTRLIIEVSFRNEDWNSLAAHCDLLAESKQATSDVKEAAGILGAYARGRHYGKTREIL